MSVVLDASVAVACLFADEHSEATHDAMRRIVRDGATVPALWRLEVANVPRNAVRRRRCDDAYADRSLARQAHLAIKTDEETDRHAWDATQNLAREEDLTVYDATYLERALRLKQPLASFHTALAAAAVRRHVDVLAT